MDGKNENERSIKMDVFLFTFGDVFTIFIYIYIVGRLDYHSS